MEKSFQPQEIHPGPVAAPAPHAPSPTATAPAAGNICQRCQLPSDETHQVGDGPRLCVTCMRRAEEDAKRAEMAKKQPRVDTEMERLREMRAAEAEQERTRPIRFCDMQEHHDSPYHAGKPAIALVGGRFVCGECCPVELNPSRLAERLGALEAALAQPSAKSRKTGAQ